MSNPLAELASYLLDIAPNVDVSQEIDKIARWAYLAERSIGTATTNGALPHKECVLTVKDWQAQLPPDFFKVNAVKTGTYTFARYTGRSFYLFNQDSPFLANRGSLLNDNYNLFQGFNYGNTTYNIEGNFLYLSQNLPHVGLSYQALPVDKDGMPLINKNHLLAAAKFIRYNLVSSRYFDGKVPEHVYQNAKLEWEQERIRAQYIDDMINYDEAKFVGGIFSTPVHSPDLDTAWANNWAGGGLWD